MNKTQYKPSSTTLSKGNAYIDNSIFMEFVDDIATEMTELMFQEDSDYLLEDAQDYYNDKYDEIETKLNNTLRVYSDECIR